MTVRTFYCDKTNFYNTAPRGVQSRDEEIVKEEIAKKQERFGRKEDEPMPRWLQLEVAGRILDTYVR